MPCGETVSGQWDGEQSKSARLNALAYKAREDFNLLLGCPALSFVAKY